MKKVIAIVGSPRPKGETNAMVDLAFETLRSLGIECQKIALSEYKIKPCIACGLCKQSLTCSIKDDGMVDLYNDLIKADALIFATPTYMGGMSAQLKALLDRSVALRRNGFLWKDKFAAVLAVGGSRNGGQELAIAQVQAFMHVQGMLPVGDDSHFGGIVQAPLLEDKLGQETVIKTAQKLARLILK